MPVYNGEKYLKLAIESILNQSYSDFKFLILNDFSTDNSHNIITNFSDPRIIYVKNESNLRLAKTLNKALEIAKDATFIFRMDQDDLSHPKRLHLQLDYLNKNPTVGILGAKMKIIDSERIIDYPCGPDLVKVHLLTYNPIGHPVVAIRASFLHEYDLKYREDIYTEDYDLWVRCSKFLKIDNLNEVLLSYRLHEGQMTGQTLKVAHDIKAGREYQLREYLKLNLEPLQLDLLHSLIEGSIEVQKENLLQIKKVLNKIYSFNKKVGFYNQTILVAFMNDYLQVPLLTYRTKFFKNSSINFKELAEYFFSPFNHYSAFGLRESLGILKRCLLDLK